MMGNMNVKEVELFSDDFNITDQYGYSMAIQDPL